MVRNNKMIQDANSALSADRVNLLKSCSLLHGCSAVRRKSRIRRSTSDIRIVLLISKEEYETSHNTELPGFSETDKNRSYGEIRYPRSSRPERA